MQSNFSFFPLDFYRNHLTTINGIHFTHREIDVISCLLSARKTSKTATLLSINTRTVETHINNVMRKLECNTREGILDFIETSDKITPLRKHYSFLKINAIFEKSLRDIAKLTRDQHPRCFIVQRDEKDPFLTSLKLHLKCAGIQISSNIDSHEVDNVILSLPRTPIDEEITLLLQSIPQEAKVFLLSQEREHQKILAQKGREFEIIELARERNYYFSFFLILKKLLPAVDLSKIIGDFKEHYNHVYKEVDVPISSSTINGFPNASSSKRRYYLFALVIIGVLSPGCFLFEWSQEDSSKKILRSDLVIPKESVLLDRPELITQIDDKLKGREGIQTLALIGPGGAGKTTLARIYAHQHTTSCVWEINAETPTTLKASFETLALRLSQTEADKKILKHIQGTKDEEKQTEELIQFVRDRLRVHPNWLLIYDNLESFVDVQKYFPYDPILWGQGKVLLTTRNRNLENNVHVHYAVSVADLTADQKFDLFKKIMENESSPFLVEIHAHEARRFLEKIPPFPLDVSIAAYYLKVTRLPYSIYLENLFEPNKEFMNIQEDLLKEIGEYTETRHKIISLSLKKIANMSQDFGDLLLLISLLDSQNIPKELLTSFKNEGIVERFILNLQKYSLLTDQVRRPSSAVTQSISIHRSTQIIASNYLTKALGLGKNKELIKRVSESLESYLNEIIKDEDIRKMEALISHCAAFLRHQSLVTENVEGAIKGNLGIIYYYHADDIKAKALLEEGLAKLQKNPAENSLRIAWFLGYLGNIYRDLGNYHQGKFFLKKSLSIYQKHYPKDALRHACFIAYLGIIERYLGDYSESRKLFLQGLALHKSFFPSNENYFAWVLGQLGILEREQGHYENARISLEKSLALFKKERSCDHFDIAWALEHLGVVYTKLGQYTKAKDAFKQSLQSYALTFPDQLGESWIIEAIDDHAPFANYKNISDLFQKIQKTYERHFPECYIYAAWPLHQLGNLYIELKHFKKARVLLEQSLSIYKKNYGDQHLTTAQVLVDLGRLSLHEGDLDTATKFASTALRIFEHDHHPTCYLCLETLAEIFMKKATLAQKKGDQRQAETLRQQMIAYLTQALNIANTSFPKGNLHRQRIQLNLSCL